MTREREPWFAARYALLRDLDSERLYPFGVLLEREDGGAKLHTYGRPPASMGLRQEYDDFDSALETMSRNCLVSAIGREAANSQERP